MYSISSSDKIKRCPCCGNQYPTEIIDNNTVYVHCEHCGFKTKEYYYTDKQKEIDEWNNSDSPWHTGTPTEDGWYLCAYDTDIYLANYWCGCGWLKQYRAEGIDCRQGLVAWQKIEPYEGTKEK